jgi:hypothetical protein
MKFATLFVVAAVSSSNMLGAPTPKLLSKIEPLPVALSDDFQFRKTKIFSTEARTGSHRPSSFARNPAIAEASINFEKSYRLYGALTAIDTLQKSGDYFDFFWRAKRRTDLTVRLEYRQEKLRSFVQAREISYPNAKGNYKSEFAIIGDDYFNDGRVIAWRCLLIENGQIVAENRSYLWE